jgi:ribosomal protein L37AE/L43A
MREQRFRTILFHMPKPRTCQKCGSSNLKRRSTTYPLMLPGRQINVARVQVHECADCGTLTPTVAGQAKLQRCLAAIGAMLENGPK